jgi:hypothetical protein
LATVLGGIGPRFAFEAGFLIALAIAAGVAQLSATAIIVVMALAWLLVCLFELATWVEGPRFPAFRRYPANGGEPDEITPVESVHGTAPAAEVEAPEERPGRRRFRRRRAVSGGEA